MDVTRRDLVLGAGATLAMAGASQAHTATAGLAAARDSLRRLIGPAADRIEMSLATSPSAPSWNVSRNGRTIHVQGTSPVAVVRGACDSLARAGALHVAWDGRRVAANPLDALPAHASATSPYRFRAYLNPCTYGYTAPFWDFADWEAEIDWMAAHGINMPLAEEGQEWVWRELWRSEGIGEDELAAFFSGPAFMPWQRMGNIEGYRGPVPDTFFRKKRDLQTKILERMRALGMTPVLPGFAGYVPKAFALRHPEARIYRMIPWGGFHETFWLDPADPLFARLSQRYLDLYEKTYGRGTYWLVDAFNEMLPPVSATEPMPDSNGFFHAREPDAALAADVRDAQLAAYGAALHSALSSARPEAVFVMQGWMFSFQSGFWTPDAIQAFLSRMPSDQTLILDLANDTYPGGWERAKAYFGKPWIFGYVQNFGGNNPLTGDLELYRKDLTGLAKRPDKGNLAGIGLFPEGLHANPLVYAYLCDQAWTPDDQPVAQWLHGYARSRYGQPSPEMDTALAAVAEVFYRTRNWDFGWKDGFGTYLLCKRPKPDLVELTHPEDLTAGKAAVAAFLALWPRFGVSPLYRHDAIAFLVHLASLSVDRDLTRIMKAYAADDIATGDKLWATVQAQLADLDLLMGEQPDSLASWLDRARRYGDTPAEAEYYLDNARAQVTIWGGDNVLNDYASKAWQGLYDDFYRRRWQLYFDAMRTADSQVDGAAVNQTLIAFDNEWVTHRDVVTVRRPAEPYALAQTVLQRVTA